MTVRRRSWSRLLRQCAGNDPADAMFCAQCTLLDIHRDFAGSPQWLRHDGVDTQPMSPDAGPLRRERYVCPIAGCGARWSRVSDARAPMKRRWELLLE